MSAFDETTMLKLKLIAEASDVVGDDPQFWSRGDVNRFPKLAQRQTALRIRAKEQLLADPKEELVENKAWFPHRRLDPFARTLQFVFEYDQALLRYMDLNADASEGQRQLYRLRGHYQTQAQLACPWAITERKHGHVRMSPRWTSFVRARRTADSMVLPYADFIDASLVAAGKRGWAHAYCNNPAQLNNAKLMGGCDKYTDATIAGILLKKYATEPRLCHDDYFRAAQWAEDPIQVAYYRFLARELMRVNDQNFFASAIAWKRYVKFDIVPQVLDFESVLASSAAVGLSST